MLFARGAQWQCPLTAAAPVCMSGVLESLPANGRGRGGGGAARRERQAGERVRAKVVTDKKRNICLIIVATPRPL